MKVTFAPAALLKPVQLQLWAEIQRADARYDSPYFCPEFTLALSAVRDDVEVGLLWSREELVGFFPYQRFPGNVGKPAGLDMSDFHAAVVREGTHWQADELIRGCNLVSWSFHHLSAWQSQFQDHQLETMISPYIELTGPFPSSDSGSARVGPGGFHDFGKKWRKFCREVGPLRFVHDIPDGEQSNALFETLINWKRSQYLRTGVVNIFADPWRRALLERILKGQIPQGGSDDFGGVMSALYVGDRPVAIHLGLRSRTVLHSWFPVYDPEFAQYSPGLLMFCELCKAAAADGFKRLDLGKGTTRFKTSLMTGSTLVAEGAVDRRALHRNARKIWYQTCDWIRGSRLRPLAHAGVTLVRPMHRWFSDKSRKSISASVIISEE